MNNNVVIAALVIVVLVLAGVVFQQYNHPKTPGQEIADGVGHALDNAGQSIQHASGK